MALTGDAYEGQRAGVLTSDTSSTKWLYQAAAVDAGHWYRARAVGRIVDGAGELFIRLSWYASDDSTGTALESADSGAVSGAEWSQMELVASAPASANSVRFRLMLRPEGPVTGAFDAAELVETEEPPASPVAPNGNEPVAAPPLADTGPVPPPAHPVAPERPAADTAPAAALAGETGLRLSEVMSDPEETGRDGAYEWVELVNVGTAAVDLAFWKLGDSQELDALPALSVPPAGYVVVAAKSAAVPPGVPAVRVPDGEIGAGLNNAGDTVRLVAPDGTEVDVISYGDDSTVFEPPPPAPGAGATLGVRAPGSEPSAENWAITERPSPGAPNTFPPPKRGATATSGRSGEGVPQPESTVVEGAAGEPSAVPWVLLGIASGLGMTGTGLAIRRAWPGVRHRLRHGG